MVLRRRLVFRLQIAGKDEHQDRDDRRLVAEHSGASTDFFNEFTEVSCDLLLRCR
jgi:hypothetical protein